MKLYRQKSTGQGNAPMLWVIGGSDTRAGAGVQADLLTANDLRVCCATVVTAVTAQSRQQVSAVQSVSEALLEQQLQTLLDDGQPQAIKIGLLVSQAQVSTLTAWLEKHPTPMVLDPVQIASTGNTLTDEPVDLSPLYPFCTLVTPNERESKRLGGVDAIVAGGAQALLVTGCASTGEKTTGVIEERLYDFSDNSEECWRHPRVDTQNTHGTGCTLATGIAAELARGLVLRDAVTVAIAYVQHGLQPDAVANARQSVGHRGCPTRAELWPQVAIAGGPTGQWVFPALIKPLGFYPVVDSFAWVEKLLAMGVRTLQLRIKSNAHPQQLRLDLANAIALAKSVNAQLFINDHWQLACELGAYGIHLGQEDLLDADLAAIAECGMRLGVSTHSLFEISIALGLRPSYYALGHIFATKTKQMPSQPQGLARLAEQAHLLRDRPTVAIGGINRSNAEQVLATGVSGLAVVRAVTESVNLRGTIQQFIEIFDRYRLDPNIEREQVYASVG